MWYFRVRCLPLHAWQHGGGVLRRSHRVHQCTYLASHRHAVRQGPCRTWPATALPYVLLVSYCRPGAGTDPPPPGPFLSQVA